MVAMALALGGCASGSGIVRHATPAVAATPASFPLAAATLQLRIPAPAAASAKRRPAYVSSATLGVSIALASASALSSTDLATYNATYGGIEGATPGSTTCPATGSGATAGYVCTFAVELPPGDDGLVVTTYDGATQTAHVLSRQTQTVSVVSDAANTFAVTVDANTGAIRLGAPSSGVTLTGSSCTGTTISGSSDLSGTCTATLAGGGASFSVAILDPASVVVPSGSTGYPTLSATSSNPAYTVSLSGQTLTIAAAAPACPATAATTGPSTITVTSTSAMPATDGLSPVSLTFTVATAPYAGQRVYVANYDADTITVYPVKPSGTVTAAPIAELCASTASGTTAAIDHPTALAIDASGKYLYVANEGGASRGVPGFVSIFNLPTGFTASSPVATIAGGSSGLYSPQGIAVDASRRVYVVDKGANALYLFADPTAAGASAGAAPLASQTGYNEPFGITLDASGHIYLAEYSGSTLYIYAAYSGIAGAPFVQLSAQSSSGNSIPADDTILDPTSVALDSSGRIYVLDLGRENLTIYSAFNGATTPTLLGTMGTGSYQQPFGYDYGIAFDANDGLYAVDAGTNFTNQYSPGRVVYFAHVDPAAPPTTPDGIISGGNSGISAATSPYAIAIH